MKASELLDQEMGTSAPRSRADWTFSIDDRGREIVDLSVSDWTGSVGYKFAATELSDEDHMKHRLHRLWGDLLMVRSHVQMDSRLGASRD